MVENFYCSTSRAHAGAHDRLGTNPHSLGVPEKRLAAAVQKFEEDWYWFSFAELAPKPAGPSSSSTSADAMVLTELQAEWCDDLRLRSKRARWKEARSDRTHGRRGRKRRQSPRLLGESPQKVALACTAACVAQVHIFYNYVYMYIHI